MADTLTSNLSFTKPQVGGSTDTWGTKLNANWDILDAIFAAGGTGTSVGLNIGAGKTLKVDGTLNAPSGATVIIKGNTVSTFGASLLDDADATAARSTLGLVIGTNVQAFDATLQSIASLGTTADRLAYTTGVDTWAETPLTSLARTLLDDTTTTAMRSTLGLVIGTNVQAFDATLAALAGLTIAADSLTIGTGADAFSQTTFAANTFPARASTGSLVAKPITDFGLSLVDDASNSAARTTLGLVIGTDVQAFDATLNALAGANWAANSLAIGSGTDTVAQVTFAANTFPGRSSTGNLVAKAITDLAFSLLDDTTTGAMQSTLGLVIGTNVQAFDATLAALAGANWAANTLPIGSGADTVSQVTFNANTFPARSSTGNLVAKAITDFGLSLVDDADASAGRTTLGLGSIATQASSSVSITGGSITGITDLAVADGGTGASTAADARTNLGLGTMATRNVTVSTSAPSGGSDGDIWFVREV